MMQPQFAEILLGVLIYGLGAGLYASKIPERCKPGTFDMCGHSH
jgi:adiponectin receptor